jgi:hypothetical protein
MIDHRVVPMSAVVADIQFAYEYATAEINSALDQLETVRATLRRWEHLRPPDGTGRIHDAEALLKHRHARLLNTLSEARVIQLRTECMMQRLLDTMSVPSEEEVFIWEPK